MIYYLLILLLSLLPLVSIFDTSLLLHTQDGLVHLPRLAAYFKALSSGEFPVRWVSDLNYGYGMPLFNFIYHTPYLVGSVFLFLGFNLVNSFKLALSLSYVLSGIFALLFGRAFFKDNKKAFLFAVFYQFFPFRLVELLVRGSFGELYAYALLPLVLFGITQIRNSQSTAFGRTEYFNVLLTVVATFFLIFSHNSVSLLFFAISLGFILLFGRSRRAMVTSGISLFLGVFLAAFYWLPAITEHKYTYGDLYMKDLYLQHFAPFQNFFMPNFFNSPSLRVGGVSIQIGLFQVIAIFLALWFVFGRKPDRVSKKFYSFSLLVFAISLFFMQPVSKVFWSHVSLLRQFQFPWRFLSAISIISAFSATAFLEFEIFRKLSVYILVLVLVVGSTFFYWHPAFGYDKINQNYYWNFPLDTTYYGETDVIWSAGPAKQYPPSPVQVISGKATILNYTKKTTVHTYFVHAQTNTVRLVDHTEYYPGWRVYVDGREVLIQFQDPNWRGELTFAVPPGIHSVRVEFSETKLRLAADVVSLFTLIALGIGFVYFLTRKQKKEPFLKVKKPRKKVN